MRPLKLVRLVAPVILLATLAFGPPVAAAGPPDSSNYDGLVAKAQANGSVRVLVTATDMETQAGVAASIEGADADIVIRYELFPILLVEAGPSAVRELIADARVEGLQEDLLRRPTLASTIPLINADDVQGFGYDGTGMTVAILDTGIDTDHPFYSGRVVSEACYSNAGGSGSGLTLCPGGATSSTAADSADTETLANCQNGSVNICAHGSHVAGIAAGEATGASGEPGNGVAPDASVIAIQVFTRFNGASACSPSAAPCVLTYDSDQILGLQRVLALDDSSGGSLDVSSANMSLGGGMNSAACDGDSRKAAIDALLAANVATVIAAGNNGFGAAVGAPGCISTAVTVGATDDSDNVASFSNRGTLLDLFAPGVSVDSSVPDDAWANFQGTSMSAPHVTGAWAVLRDIYPNASVATILGWLQDNGVDITYASGGGNVTTPRIDLLAAVQPVLAADDASVTVDEGQTAANTGTFSDPNGDSVALSASVGTVSDTGGGTWSWSFATSDGPTQSQTVTITGTDSTGISGTTTFALVVNNVEPTVTITPGHPTAIDEGDTLSVAATFSDPGYADTYTAQIDWGDGNVDAVTATVTTEGGPGPDLGSVSGSHPYGDDGNFTVEVSVTDDDGGTGSDDFALAVANVDPTADIDMSDAIDVNGTQTIIGEAGQPVDFSGRSTDPGSDDLTLSWDFGDGPPAPDVSTIYLVNPPNPDPDPSTSVQPRDVTDEVSHTFADACTYDITFTSEDDDGGSAQDGAAVIITGNADRAQQFSYWMYQYDDDGEDSIFSQATLSCYLAIARAASDVFDEETALATLSDASNVLHMTGLDPMHIRKFDRQLLTALLNFANGAYDWDQLVRDSNGDGVLDRTVAQVIAQAETVRLNPSSTKKQVESQESILATLNHFGP